MPRRRMAIGAYRLAFEGKVAETLAQLEALRATGFDDPEGWYL